MNQKVAISISAAAVAALAAAVVALVQTCSITIQDQPVDAGPDVVDASGDTGPLTDSAAMPPASDDASVAVTRWGSLVPTCNLMGTCEASIACENSSRYHLRCKFSGRSGMQPPVFQPSDGGSGGKAPPVVVIQYAQYGSLVEACDRAATCADSIACENRLRSTYACQTTRAAP